MPSTGTSTAARTGARGIELPALGGQRAYAVAMTTEPVTAPHMIEHRVRLTRDEAAAVAAGTYVPGTVPVHGAPTVIDKRAQNAARKQAERDAQAAWVRQAAGTLWWSAQRVNSPARREKILAKRSELITGALAKGLDLGGLTV